jgi:superfamily II DNA or RNA helicase
VLPSSDPQVVRLRPLLGDDTFTTGVYRPLLRTGVERIEPASFPPLPIAADADYTAARLLREAMRLTLRNGAGPFRCAGNLSFRPRPYQLVALIMALRMQPVRLLIADDVGIGKTIEAGLIARELIDRGEVRRLAVLCPPYLCDQWQRELQDKFNLPAVVVRSSTLARLERDVPQGRSLFQHYPCLVLSIDWAKTDRWRPSFLEDCPEFVIVDEAHACARPRDDTVQQQRYELVAKIAEAPQRHLLLLTATPHSGIEESFRSLLGLLDRRFARADFPEHELTRYVLQRRRRDVEQWLGELTPFPQREVREQPYRLSADYRQLFQDVLDFARELVRAPGARQAQQRVRYWAALALLRCVMSSPQAARDALLRRAGDDPTAAGDEDELVDDELAATFLYDRSDAETSEDAEPSAVVERGAETMLDREKRRLRELAQRAQRLAPAGDAKLETLVRVVAELLKDGFSPIVYCRFIRTAEYVAAQLATQLEPTYQDLTVQAVTGLLSDEEREERVATLGRCPRRVLVATDCLSEGINLQDYFDAVVHYDLPWNPGRMEQREGRVDRFGQRRAKVRTVLLYGEDNPVDGVVLDVLLRKARAIRQRLGVAVPVPIDSERVLQALLEAVLLRPSLGGWQQLSLLEVPAAMQLDQAWQRAEQREAELRTRFAQEAIKPEVVARELEVTDEVLGDPAAVRAFVATCFQRLGDQPLFDQQRGTVAVNLGVLPDSLQRQVAPHLGKAAGRVTLAFTQPAPEGTHYIGRHHPLVGALARLVLGQAFRPDGPTARLGARTAVVRTRSVTRRTVVWLLRLRYLLRPRDGTHPLLAEEVVLTGHRGSPARGEWLSPAEALRLVVEAQADANVAPAERREHLDQAIAWQPALAAYLERLAHERAAAVLAAHQRVRRLTAASPLEVEPYLPVDVVGAYVYLPVVV